jgi:hypothetical protein
MPSCFVRMRITTWLVLMLTCAPAAAQDARLKWNVNFEATWGTFGFGNSLFQDPKEDTPLDLSDQWFEGTMKGGLNAVFTTSSTAQIYGAISAVGERTYGAAPRIIGPDLSSFGPEDLSIGWRSGEAIGSGENLIDLVVGRIPYRIGHGMLVADGAAEGGTRGGYWSNARKAFELGAVARLSPGRSRIEAFYLDRDDLPEHDTGTRLTGANYEFVAADHSTFGASWFRTFANADASARYDGMDVFNVRAYTAPPALRGLGIDAEYAAERNGDTVAADAWTIEPSYAIATAWSPRLSYRFAYFEGDDPGTAANEAFEPLMPGFHDWGTWFQGEIVGGYALANSNLLSHRARIHVEPSDTISGGLMLYKFLIDQPGTFEAGVTSRDFALETDLYVDWQIRERLTASFVVAFADPGAAVEQAYARNESFRYGMVFLAYKY